MKQGKSRLNVKDDDIVSGVKTITANDGKKIMEMYQLS